MRRLFSGIVLALLLASMSTVAFHVQSAKSDYVATTPIYIRTDGSIDPSTALISTVDNVTYALTGNIYDSIVIERDNIMIDGAGYAVQGEGAFASTALDLTGRSNITIKNAEVKTFDNGISLYGSSNITILQNTLTNVVYGIVLDTQSNWNTVSRNEITSSSESGIVAVYSSFNDISGNNITDNGWYGILFTQSYNNTVFMNNIADNSEYGVRLQLSSNNTFCHNNIINNGRFNQYVQVWVTSGCGNFWDDGYPSGGNYWSNYTGLDMKNGFYQNETGSDGIGDTPYIIDSNNVDNYPLVAPINFFDAGNWNDTTYYVNIVSNSTLSHFHFDPDEGPFMSFWVNGETDTHSFCRVAIPKDLLWVEDGWEIQYGGVRINYRLITDDNGTYLYFTYTNPGINGFITVTINGTHVIPEFPSFLILSLFMIATLLAVTVYRRRMDGADV